METPASRNDEVKDEERPDSESGSRRRPVWSPGFSRSVPPEGGTPYRRHDPDGFIVPMHSINAAEASPEPQGAAGILPAEESERSSADETSAAPCWRHRLTRS